MPGGGTGLVGFLPGGHWRDGQSLYYPSQKRRCCLSGSGRRRNRRVRLLSGEVPAELLRGKTMSARIVLQGNLSIRCGGIVQAGGTRFFHAWGLEGAYAVTAVEHRWERGLFTTAVSLEK